LVKGSHGRILHDANRGPVFITSEPQLLPEGPVEATAVKEIILAHVFE
jgi:hypothetical protein